MSFEDRPSRMLVAMLRALALAMAVLTIGSCEARTSVLHPRFADGGLLKGSVPVKLELLAGLNGMYAVGAGGSRFGRRVAVRAAPDTLSIFAEPNANYAILGAGCIDGGARLVLEGHWRYPADTSTGLLRLFVGPASVVESLCGGTALPVDAAGAPLVKPVLNGLLGDGAADPSETMAFTFGNVLLNGDGRFNVVGHHGACRTIDDCGVSENSIESMKLVQAYGASIVEIDVHLTADGIPFLFHDDNFGPRLTNGPYCHGPVDEFTFAHVRALCTLKFGEVVPTLEEALEAAYSQTLLRAVWIDAKTPEVVAPAIAVIAAFNARVQGNARKMPIVLGLGESDVLDAYRAANPPVGFPCLIELEPSDVRANGCIAWGPRYTRGALVDDVKSLQADGHFVAFWTVDEEDFIKLFLKSEAMPNAILSDRAGLVFWLFQTLATKETLPPEHPTL